MKPGEVVKFHSPTGSYVPVRSPLISVGAVQSVLYRDSKKIMELVEDGTLLFGFDIRCMTGGRIVLRISTQSLIDYVSGKKTQSGWSLDQFLQSILPPLRNAIPATVVARTLNCDADHVGNLVREGSLNESARRTFRRQTPQISRESLLRFLKQRRVL